MSRVKIKSLIFEEVEQKIDRTSILDILEEVVETIELKTQGLQIVRPLFKSRKDLYLLQVSLDEGIVLLDIFFDVSFLDSEQLEIEVRPSKQEIGQEPDVEIIFFNNEEDIKEQVLQFILSRFEKYKKTELLGREKHDFVSEFQKVYNEIFKKNGFKIIKVDKLVDSNNSFFIDANDNKNRYINFVVRIFEDKFTVVLMSELLEQDLTTGGVYYKNYEYDFEKALNWAINYLESQYDFFINIDI